MRILFMSIYSVDSFVQTAVKLINRDPLVQFGLALHLEKRGPNSNFFHSLFNKAHALCLHPEASFSNTCTLHKRSHSSTLANSSSTKKWLESEL